MRRPSVALFAIAFGFLAISSSGQELTPSEKAERIKQAMPSALPQEPVVPKAASDAADLGLKGHVKTVSLASGPEKASRPDYTYEFDKKGALLTEIHYDYNGNPWRIMVFGYVDGKRVWKDAVIWYDYDPPAAAAPKRPANQPIERPDTRYAYAYEYTYGKDGLLLEERLLSNTGKLVSRSTSTATGSTIEHITYDRNDKVTSQNTEIYDAKGRLIESRFPASNGYGPSENHYTYEKFDKRGNWTRRTVTGKVGRWNNAQADFKRVEERVVTYY